MVHGAAPVRRLAYNFIPEVTIKMVRGGFF
jgi:hypothetical protein